MSTVTDVGEQRVEENGIFRPLNAEERTAYIVAKASEYRQKQEDSAAKRLHRLQQAFDSITGIARMELAENQVQYVLEKVQAMHDKFEQAMEDPSRIRVSNFVLPERKN
jgi:hypothetical protein